MARLILTELCTFYGWGNIFILLLTSLFCVCLFFFFVNDKREIKILMSYCLFVVDGFYKKKKKKKSGD